ncbi:MAG: hypothetical protein J7K82_01590 [Thermoproteales archaeon]|nr:hypothetical protein [Thermoproteales archaeon]
MSLDISYIAKTLKKLASTSRFAGSTGEAKAKEFIVSHLESLWALVSAVTTLANLSTILYGRLGERIGDVNLLFLAGLGWSVLYTVYGLTTDITIFALFFTIPVWPAFAIGYQTLLMKLSDEGSRASIYSVDNILSTIYSASIGILGGYLAEIFTPRLLFIFAGFAVFLSAFIVKFYLLKNISS